MPLFKSHIPADVPEGPPPIIKTFIIPAHLLFCIKKVPYNVLFDIIQNILIVSKNTGNKNLMVLLPVPGTI